MRKNKRRAAGMLLAFAALFLGGCKEGESEAPDKLHVGVASYNQSDTYMNALIGRFKENMNELGSDRLEVTVTVRDAAGLQKTQNDQVEEMIDEGCNVLCVNLVDQADHGD